MSLPSQEYITSRIDYNPETGEARWKLVDESYGPHWKRFNKLSAGNSIPNSRIGLLGNKYTLARLLYKIIHNEDPKGEIVYLDGNSANIKVNNLTTVANKLANSQTATQVFTELPDNLQQYLNYDHITGDLTWLYRPDNRNWSSRWANKIAGTLSNSGYRSIKILNTSYKAHRIAWKMYYGFDPINYQIDHIDENKTNNCIKNLRLATNSFNVQHSANSKGYEYKRGKYHVSIGVNGIGVHIGVYATPEEAIEAYKSAHKKYKPIYEFTYEEQEMLDTMYVSYPNCSSDLQHACHDIQLKALKYYVDAAIVQTQN
jgi:hypothetical protein